MCILKNITDISFRVAGPLATATRSERARTCLNINCERQSPGRLQQCLVRDANRILNATANTFVFEDGNICSPVSRTQTSTQCSAKDGNILSTERTVSSTQTGAQLWSTWTQQQQGSNPLGVELVWQQTEESKTAWSELVLVKPLTSHTFASQTYLMRTLVEISLTGHKRPNEKLYVANSCAEYFNCPQTHQLQTARSQLFW